MHIMTILDDLRSSTVFIPPTKFPKNFPARARVSATTSEVDLERLITQDYPAYEVRFTEKSKWFIRNRPAGRSSIKPIEATSHEPTATEGDDISLADVTIGMSKAQRDAIFKAFGFNQPEPVKEAPAPIPPTQPTSKKKKTRPLQQGQEEIIKEAMKGGMFDESMLAQIIKQVDSSPDPELVSPAPTDNRPHLLTPKVESTLEPTVPEETSDEYSYTFEDEPIVLPEVVIPPMDEVPDDDSDEYSYTFEDL